MQLDILLKRELGIPLGDSTFWTDSQVTLVYIQKDSDRYKVFVANWVSLIRQHSSPKQWNYVSGSLNPADIVSRGCAATGLPPSWVNGPSFLSEFKCDWGADSGGNSVSLLKSF